MVAERHQKLQTLLIRRGTVRGTYDELIDFLEDARAVYGSAPNAVRVILTNSSEYRRWKRAQPQRPIPDV